MHRFFVPPEKHKDGAFIFSEEESKHAIKVLRLRQGDAVEVLDGLGNIYGCIISDADPKEVIAGSAVELPSREPNCRVTLYPGLLKGDRMELVIQKAVELGVFAVRPVQTKRCVVRVSEGEAAAKAVRWQRVAAEAAKQCGRGLIPTIYPPITVERAITAAEHALRLVPWEEERAVSLREALTEANLTPENADIGILIGPEGGLANAEVDLWAKAAGRAVSLGPRILRAETASIAALTATLYHYNDL